MTNYLYDETDFTSVGSPTVINLNTLHQDIEGSAIATATLQYINRTSGVDVTFVFDNSLSTGSPSEQIMLDNIVASHDGSDPTPTPIPTPNDGDTWFDPTVGIWFQYDSNRSKWLSVNRTHMLFSRETYGSFSSGTLNIGGISSKSAGFRTTYKGTIVSIKAEVTGGYQTKTFNIMANELVKGTFSLTNGKYTNLNANVDIDQDAIVCCLATGTDQIDNPIVEIELAYRY